MNREQCILIAPVNIRKEFIMMRFCDLTILVIMLSACKNDNYHFLNPETVSFGSPLKDNKKNELPKKKISRMERIRLQGCKDYSADCGFPANWESIINEK